MTWFRENEDSNPRCPCCHRFLDVKDLHAGHINSAKNGGSTEIKNGLAICKRCNNNDTRNIPEMMLNEWGENHPNTKRIYKLLKDLEKIDLI